VQAALEWWPWKSYKENYDPRDREPNQRDNHGRVIQSKSDSEKKYLVAEIETFNKPQDHPRLDYVADRITLRTCSCWSWRNKSADLQQGQSPSECGTCKHLTAWKREERAEADDKQVTL